MFIFPVMTITALFTAPCRYVVFCLLVCSILASHSLPAVVCTTPFASQPRASFKKGVALPGLHLDTALSFIFMSLYVRLLQPSVNHHEVFTFILDSRTDQLLYRVIDVYSHVLASLHIIPASSRLVVK